MYNVGHFRSERSSESLPTVAASMLLKSQSQSQVVGGADRVLKKLSAKLHAVYITQYMFYTSILSSLLTE